MAGTEELLQKSMSIDVSNFGKIMASRMNYLIEAESKDGTMNSFNPHLRRALETEFSAATYVDRPPMTYKEIMMSDITLYDFKEKIREVYEKALIAPQLLIIKAPIWPPWAINYTQTLSLIADRSARSLVTWLVCSDLSKLIENKNVPSSFLEWIRYMKDERSRFERISLVSVKEEANEKKKKKEINVHQGLGLTGINQNILADPTGTVQIRIPMIRKSLERSLD
jgi:hypothetical protein